MKSKNRAKHRKFECGGGFNISNDSVCQAKRTIIHGTRRRHTHGPVTDPAGKILNRGNRAGFHHFNGSGNKFETAEERSRRMARHKIGFIHYGPEIITIGFDPAGKSGFYPKAIRMASIASLREGFATINLATSGS